MCFVGKRQWCVWKSVPNGFYRAVRVEEASEEAVEKRRENSDSGAGNWLAASVGEARAVRDLVVFSDRMSDSTVLSVNPLAETRLC